MSRDIAASIRARLKRHADVRKQDFNLTLTQYGLERLLYRLSISPHASHYLLKGALLFAIWYEQPHRPTRDADLLGFGPDDVESAVRSFREICQMPVTMASPSMPRQCVEPSSARKPAMAACASTCEPRWTAHASHFKWISALAMP